MTSNMVFDPGINLQAFADFDHFFRVTRAGILKALRVAAEGMSTLYASTSERCLAAGPVRTARKPEPTVESDRA
jgi:hypothetical protein